jgi:hypothetical protein
MPETYGLPEPETPRTERIVSATREVIAGDKRAAVRRIILWVLALALLVGGADAWIVLLPLALLMATDGLL